MKMNNRLYQYLIILMTMSNVSFVYANDDNVTRTKEKAAMPAAPSGPYRSQSDRDISKQINVTKRMQQPKQSLPAVQLAQRPAQQQMRPPVAPPAWANQAPPQRMMQPNWNQNVPPQPQWVQPEVPDWVKNPPRGPKPPKWVTNPPEPPAWVKNIPQQRMQPPQVPEWVKNPPYGPKPPEWVINPPQYPVYRGQN